LKLIVKRFVNLVTSRTPLRRWLLRWLTDFAFRMCVFSVGVAGFLVKAREIHFVSERAIYDWGPTRLAKVLLFMNNIINIPARFEETKRLQYDVLADLLNFVAGCYYDQNEWWDSFLRNLIRFQGKLGAHVILHTMDTDTAEQMLNKEWRLGPAVGVNTIGSTMRRGVNEGRGKYYCGMYLNEFTSCGPRAGPQCYHCQQAQAAMQSRDTLFSAGIAHHQGFDTHKTPPASTGKPFRRELDEERSDSPEDRHTSIGSDEEPLPFKKVRTDETLNSYISNDNLDTITSPLLSARFEDVEAQVSGFEPRVRVVRASSCRPHIRQFDKPRANSPGNWTTVQVDLPRMDSAQEVFDRCSADRCHPVLCARQE